MARHMSLSFTPESSGQPLEPLTFDLRGEDFTCVDEIPAAVVLRLGTAQDPDAKEYERMKAINSFFASIVIPADRARFQNLLESASPVIGVAELVDYMSQLAEAVSDRPTEGQESSPGSLSDMPLTLTEGSSEPDTAAASSI